MKAGDLVKKKGENWIGLVLKMCGSSGYIYPELVWLDKWAAGDFEVDSCSSTLLEVISESR
jgi:hypothetical protein